MVSLFCSTLRRRMVGEKGTGGGESGVCGSGSGEGREDGLDSGYFL